MRYFFQRLVLICLLISSHVFPVGVNPFVQSTMYLGKQNPIQPAKQIITHDSIFKNFSKMSLDGAKPLSLPKEIYNASKPVDPFWSAQDFAYHFLKTSPENTIVVRPEYQAFLGNTAQNIPIAAHSHTFTPEQQKVICSQFELYAHPGFRDFVRTLPEFPKFIVEWKNQLWHNPELIKTRNAQMDKIPEIRAVYNERQSTFCSLMCEWFKDQCYVTKQEVIANDTVAQVPAITKQVQETMADPLISPQLENVCQIRIDALQETVATNGACTVQTREVTPALIQEAQNHGLSPQQLEVSCGSAIMHTVNGESVDVLEQTWQLPEGFLIPDVRNCAFAALSYTHEGKIGKAIALTDVCYVALDHMKKFGADCFYGIALGAGDAVYNVGHMIIRPDQAAYEIITGLSHLASYVGKAACIIAHVEPLPWLNHYTTLEEHIAAIEENRNHTIAAISTVAQKLAAMSTRDLIRHGTSFFLDAWLTGKALTGLGSLCAKAEMLSTVASNIIKTTVRGSEVLEPVAPGIGKVEGLKPSRIQMWFNEAEGQIKNVAQEIKQIVPGKVKGYISACGENFEHLSKMYDGIVTFKDKLVRINYKHLFGLEIEEITKQTGRIERSFTGFHHDYLGKLEKSGVVQLLNKQICPKTGIIDTIISWNGVTQRKTLFPGTWTREQVVQKIFEALKNSSSEPRFYKGNWLIDGLTKEGVNIKIIINQKGTIVTAYPEYLY